MVKSDPIGFYSFIFDVL